MAKECLVFHDYDEYEGERNTFTIEIDYETTELVVTQEYSGKFCLQNICRLPITRARLESIIGFLSSKLDTL